MEDRQKAVERREREVREMGKKAAELEQAVDEREQGLDQRRCESEERSKRVEGLEAQMETLFSTWWSQRVRFGTQSEFMAHYSSSVGRPSRVWW